MNEFHCSFGHLHKERLLETAKQRGVILTGELRGSVMDARGPRDAEIQLPRTPKVVQISVVAVSFPIFSDRRV